MLDGIENKILFLKIVIFFNLLRIFLLLKLIG